jgi:glycosyltransferase involved in cell wall biosynthesis
MKKLLYVAPHLSTGGLPQYLTKKIELLKNEFEIYLVEWVDCTGGVLVVTRNKIVNLIDSDKFFTLKDNKNELIDIINRVKPDIIHLEEIPEFFMDDDIAKQIYTSNRTYSIVETSHDSSFNTDEKRFFPDKFMFVSDWQIQQYKNINVPSVLVEYPIEYIERPNREEALRNLQLDPAKKHVLHVGLYTSRKNQAEFFEYAKQFPDVEFHSLGNRADNFKWYWEPLAKDQPSNLTWWNERSDVDAFYQAMDLFLFTSRGHDKDKETMPLVIREAISYQIPTLIYNLPVYLDYFNKFETIDYLKFDDFKTNCDKIAEKLGIKESNPNEEIFILSTFPISDAIVETTLKTIDSIHARGTKVLVTSHIPVPFEIEAKADYVVVDNNNILTKHSYYCNYWSDLSDHKVHINLRGNDNDVYHGPSVHSNYVNGAALAKNLGYKKLFFINFDYTIQSSHFIDYISEILDNKKAYFGKYKASEGDALYTYFCAANSDFFLDHVYQVFNAGEYENLRHQIGSESNGLENMWYHIFKRSADKIYFENVEIFEQKSIETFNHHDFSQVEYFTVLPTNIPNTFAPYIRISNSKESRLIQITVRDKDKNEVFFDELNVESKVDYYKVLPYEEGMEVEYKISNYHKTLKISTIQVKNLEFNGKLELKNHKPKVKIIHLLTYPKDEREQRSIESISPLGEYENIEYTQVINKPYTDLPPVETCNRPNDVQLEPGYYKLAPGHYGCFRAHTDAILSSPQEDDVVYLFFECDAILLTDHQVFVDKIYQAINIAQEKNYTFFSFAHNYEIFNEYDTHIDAGMFTDAHAYLIMGSKINKVHDVINNSKWDAFDLWVTNNFREEPKGFYKEPLVFQAKGYSLIDKKISETNIKGDIKL